MKPYRILAALALAVIGIIIGIIVFIISLLFGNKKREPRVRDNKEGERYLGKYELEREE